MHVMDGIEFAGLLGYAEQHGAPDLPLEFRVSAAANGINVCQAVFQQQIVRRLR